MAIGGELKIESPTSDSKVVKSIKYEEVLIVYAKTSARAGVMSCKGEL